MGSKKSKDGGGKKKKGKVLQVLVAGAAQSGKSTFFKQLQLIHFESFSPEVKGDVKKTLRSNLIFGLKDVIEAGEGMKKVKFSKSSKAAIEFFKEKNPFDDFDEETTSFAKAVWNDSGIKKVWKARDNLSSLSILHISYLMDNLDRLIDDASAPTTEDVLLARKRTTGTNELEFEFKGKQFRFVDVGGQRSERRHWDHIIEAPEAVVFFASLVDWNLPTLGNKKKTKLQESLEIWQEVIEMEAFKNSFFILMMNKIDLFAEKIKRVDIKETFPDYEGDTKDPVATSEFLRDEFLAVFPEGHQESVQSHITCALDTDQIKTVFGAMQTAMLERLMSNFGML